MLATVATIYFVAVIFLVSLQFAAYLKYAGAANKTSCSMDSARK